MIDVRELTRRYGSRYGVRDLSFIVGPGKVTGFLGPNRSGKSTTMRTIMGLDTPTSGTALINGKPYDQVRWPLREVGALLEAKAIHPAAAPTTALYATVTLGAGALLLRRRDV